MSVRRHELGEGVGSTPTLPAFQTLLLSHHSLQNPIQYQRLRCVLLFV